MVFYIYTVHLRRLFIHFFTEANTLVFLFTTTTGSTQSGWMESTCFVRSRESATLSEDGFFNSSRF